MTDPTARGPAADGTTRVPLFPLALVLFPGAELPLHIFEPRYRAMLADVRAADGRFGILLRPGEDERAIAPGAVGCYAHVREAVPLPDGRSNVLVDGGERFAFERLVADSGTPYHVAAVRPFRDDPVRDPAALASSAARARAAFVRVARAARTLAREAAPAPSGADPPALPDDDDAVAFAVCGAVEFDLAARQRVLASPDATERTAYVAALLERALPELEARAAVHLRARSNGHGPH